MLDCAENFHNYTDVKPAKYGSKQMYRRGDVLFTNDFWREFCLGKLFLNQQNIIIVVTCRS